MDIVCATGSMTMNRVPSGEPSGTRAPASCGHVAVLGVDRDHFFGLEIDQVAVCKSLCVGGLVLCSVGRGVIKDVWADNLSRN